MPKPVCLSVSEIRQAIYQAAGNRSGAGQTTNPWLGSLFHEVFRQLMLPQSPWHWETVLDADSLGDVASPGAAERLADHAWSSLVGPKLRANQAMLQRSSLEAVHFWEATQELCAYICRLLTNSQQQKLLRFNPSTYSWSGLDQFALEQEFVWRLEDPAWSAPVEVRGRADAIWRNPASKRWCVLELKLGAGAMEADLTQLCLYYCMIHGQSGEPGSLSLFHFLPQFQATSLGGESVEELRPKLIGLIASLAKVKPGTQAATPTPAHRELGLRLLQVLESFGPMASLESDPVVGPTFLRFHIMPAPGVSVRKILPLGRDLAVQLRLKRPALIRQEGGALSIDLERSDRQILPFDAFLSQLPSPASSGNARLLAGIDLNGKAHLVDLATECPHILVAGTTNSGKSEWLLSAIASLLETNTPQTLRLLLIDPKRVSFQALSASPFLLEPIQQSAEEAIEALARLNEVMEQRYSLFSQYGAKDLEALRTVLGASTPPRIVCFCDEYGNLAASKKHRESIENLVNRLGSKARAAGIHLVIATQDPRAKILSPTLKANLGGRICLKTTSATQSQMMLEENGAESLLGYGDLLFKSNGSPVRLQAPLLDESAREAIFRPRARVFGSGGNG